MKRVHKYDITPTTTNRVVVQMPVFSQILHLDIQHGRFCVWAEVIPAASLTDHAFTFVGTGHDIPDGDLTYVGTVLANGGEYVWHVYLERFPMKES